jgi:ASPIC and UnbV
MACMCTEPRCWAYSWYMARRGFYSTTTLKTFEAQFDQDPGFLYAVYYAKYLKRYLRQITIIPRKQTILEKLRAGIPRRIGLDRQVWISQEPYLFFLQGVTMGHPFFRPEIWDLTLYRAIGGDRHWLELSLAGPKANRSALGASVRVRTASATQAQAVGHAEGSLRSSGHYRVYFGLGDQERIDSVQLAWPDGRVQEIDRVAPDRLMTIQQESKD